jgi:biotin--protein ligase
VLAAVLARFDALLERFEQHGFERGILQEYEAAWLHSGQRVRVADHLGAQRDAVVQGLSVASGGALLAKDAQSGELLELFPDGNRLDFFQGLVSKKL